MDDEQEVEKDAEEKRKDIFRTHYSGAEWQDIAKLVRTMAHVQARLEEEDAKKKMFQAEFDVLRLEVLPQRCEEQGVEGMKVEGIGRLSLTGDVHVSTKPGGKVGLFGWLRKHKLGDLIVQGINASTMKAFIKGRIKAGKPMPEEFLNIKPFTRASITKG